MYIAYNLFCHAGNFICMLSQLLHPKFSYFLLFCVLKSTILMQSLYSHIILLSTQRACKGSSTHPRARPLMCSWWLSAAGRGVTGNLAFPVNAFWTSPSTSTRPAVNTVSPITILTLQLGNFASHLPRWRGAAPAPAPDTADGRTSKARRQGTLARCTVVIAAASLAFSEKAGKPAY